MGFFEEYTGYRTANFAEAINEVGKPVTAPSTSQDASDKEQRVSREELEKLFREDAQTFKLVTSYKQLLLQAGYRIVADKKTNQKQYDDFFDQIGKIGMGYKLEQLLGRIIHDCVLYGYSYIERVYDTSGRLIVDLKPIDAKLMDYARDGNGMIVTDALQKPIGYTMNVGPISRAKGDAAPRGVDVKYGHIFLDAKRIACFVVNPFSNGFEGVGYVESAYTQVKRKIKIEESASNAVYNAADSLIYAIVGDANRQASSPLMTSTLSTLKNWTTNRRAVFPYPTTVNAMPVEQSPQVNELLKYLRQEQATAGGMSLSMAIGSGETNNKSTMNTERRDFNTRLNSLAFDISTQFTSKILDELEEVNNYYSRAVLVWNNVSVDDKSDMIAHIKTLYDMKAISPDEARAYAKNVLDLETDDEKWNEYINSLEYLPEMPNMTGKKVRLPEEESSEENKVAVKKNVQESKESYEEVRE